MIVQRIAPGGDIAEIRLGHIGPAAAIDAVAILFHPCADARQDLLRLRRDASARVGADIEQQVAALAYALHQFTDQHAGGLEIAIAPAIAPMVIHGDAAFPQHLAPLRIADALGRDDLLRADEIAAEIAWLIRDQAAEALAADLQAAVREFVDAFR